MITLIAAIGRNNELGKGNDLLWRIPEDQKRMRERTTGRTIIMGRKTFESLPRALPNRRNIVITRDKNYTAPGAEVVNSLDEALDLAKNQGEIFIFGGAEIYRQAIDIADKLDITRVDAENKDAEAFFPEINPSIWKETAREERGGEPGYAFITYEKC